jgi:twitching motility protein PilI
LFGVVDLAGFLAAAHKTAPHRRTESDLAQCRLVALNPLLETGSTLLIDRRMGLRTPDTFARSEKPAAGSPDYYGHAYTDAQGRRWQEINLQRLSGSPAFLGVGG